MNRPKVEQSSPESLPIPPWGSVVFSSLVPGLGQVFAGRVVSGVLWFVTLTVGLILAVWMFISPHWPWLGFAYGLFAGVLVATIGMLVHAHRVTPQVTDADANRPWIVAFLSYLFPGLGQFYGRQIFLGVVFVVAGVGALFLKDRKSELAIAAVECASVLMAFWFGCQKAVRERRHFRLLIMALVLATVGHQVIPHGWSGLGVRAFSVPTGAMSPTLRGQAKKGDGHMRVCDHVLVDQRAYRSHPPQRGDVVVFSTRNLTELPEPFRVSYFVKRIAGLPGERVSIRPPFVLVNGQPVDEPAIMRRIQTPRDGYTGSILPGDQPMPRAKYLNAERDSVLLGDDEYFVLGDNSVASFDSRYWGPIHRRDIIGRVTKIYWPLERVGLIGPD